MERFWFASILYSVKMLSVRRQVDGKSVVAGGNGFNLCQILRALKLKYVMPNSSFLLTFLFIHLH